MDRGFMLDFERRFTRVQQCSAFFVTRAKSHFDFKTPVFSAGRSVNGSAVRSNYPAEWILCTKGLSRQTAAHFATLMLRTTSG